MKKIIKIIFSLIVLAIFIPSFLSCKKKEVKAEFYIVPAYNTIVSHRDTTIKVIVYVRKGEWKVTSKESWAIPERTSGGSGGDTINVKILVNNIRENRTAGMVFSNPGKGNSDISLSIQQKALPDILEITPKDLFINDNASSKKIVIKDNLIWGIKSLPDWITASPIVIDSTSGSITYSSMVLSFTQNPEVYFRFGDVVLEATERKKVTEMYIYQDGYGSLKTDSLALVTLYNATGGENWTRKWDLSKPLSTWAGVSIGDVIEGEVNKKRVVALNLSANNLKGELPDDVYNITMLRLLWLDKNELTGQLKDKLTKIFFLENFRMGENIDFGGELPDDIGDLLGLAYFSMYKTQLAGTIPLSIGNLSNLILLDISSNQISGSLPESLGSLSNITTFHIQNNLLSGVIPSSYLNNVQWYYWGIDEFVCPQQGAGFTNCKVDE